MKTLILTLLLTASATLLIAAVPPPADPLQVFFSEYKAPKPPQEIEDIFTEAKTDPKALEKLRDEPIEWSFKRLQSLAHPGYTRFTDNDREQHRIATDILQTHPGMGKFLADTLRRVNEVLTEKHRLTDPPTEPPNPPPPEWGAADKYQYLPLLYLARKRPGDEAFQIIGGFLSSPWWTPDPDVSTDAQSSAPAGGALGHLRELIKERLPGERPPKTVEEAREWWKANAWRFGAVAPGAPAAPAVAAGVKTTPAPAAAPTRPTTPASEPVAGVAMPPWWVLGLIVLVAVGIFLGLMASRRTG